MKTYTISDGPARPAHAAHARNFIYHGPTTITCLIPFLPPYEAAPPVPQPPQAQRRSNSHPWTALAGLRVLGGEPASCQMPLGPRVVPLPAQMQVPGSSEEEMELGMAEPLAVAVLASAAGTMDIIEDTEPPAQHHYCLSLLEEELPAAPLPSADEQIPTPDSPAPAPWPRRVRAALWRYRSVAMLAVTVLALMAGGSYACVRYRAQLLQAGDYIRRHAPISAVYYSLIVALWIVLCLPSTIIELGTWCASHSYAHTRTHTYSDAHAVPPLPTPQKQRPACSTATPWPSPA